MGQRLGAGEVYTWHLERLQSLAGKLGADQLETTVPACPDWTVRDLYGHLAGVSSDIVNPVATPALDAQHTRSHVDDRAERSLAEVSAELSANQAGVVAFLDRGVMAAPALDIWAHYNDIRGALARPREDDGDVLAFALGIVAAGHRRGWGDRDVPTLQVVGEHREWVFGAGDPDATLSAADYELARQFMGRRSRSQLLAMDWEGDPTPFVDALSVFPPPVADLVD
ncbi:MAG: maleylpyruvate isomerase family mycothiol-dependent enzyme [Acidimicrobiales bacterium]